MKTRNCSDYITSALGNSFNFGLLWAFSSIMVLRPWCGNTSKWFRPTFLQLRSFSNDQSLMNFSATHKSFKLFRGRNASSWISVMLFFSRSLKRIFIIVNTTFFAAPFKWIPKIWVVFKLSFRKQKYFSFTGISSVLLYQRCFVGKTVSATFIFNSIWSCGFVDQEGGHHIKYRSDVFVPWIQIDILWSLFPFTCKK